MNLDLVLIFLIQFHVDRYLNVFPGFHRFFQLDWISWSIRLNIKTSIMIAFSLFSKSVFCPFSMFYVELFDCFASQMFRYEKNMPVVYYILGSDKRFFQQSSANRASLY